MTATGDVMICRAFPWLHRAHAAWILGKVIADGQARIDEVELGCDGDGARQNGFGCGIGIARSSRLARAHTCLARRWCA